MQMLLVLGLLGAGAALPPVVVDCADCALVALLPAGEFVMGAEGGEPGRPDGPPHEVVISRAFGMAVTEVTNKQFRRFADATGLVDVGGCLAWPKGGAGAATAGWRDAGLGRAIRDEEPVVCVSWTEARDYAAWLGRETGKAYRLPSEAEWEYAARGGTTTAYYWGDEADKGCEFANVYDKATGDWFKWAAAACDDGAETLAAVGRYKPNAFGLYDMIGNVWEWVADCHVVPYPPGAGGQAALEAASQSGGGQVCEKRGVRGGSWMTRPERNRVTFRGRDPAETRYFMFGFRVARDLSPDEAARAGLHGAE